MLPVASTLPGSSLGPLQVPSSRHAFTAVPISRRAARSIRRHRPVQTRAAGNEEEEDAAPAKPAFPNPFAGFGTRKISAAQPKAAPATPQALGQGTQRLKRAAPGGTQRTGGSIKIGPFEFGTGPSRTGKIGRTDINTVFVAGSTGRLGARIVRELLKQPAIKVRAGVRDVEKAATYLQIAVEQGLLPADASKRISLVPVDVTKPETIAAAIGNAGRVVQATGAPESEFSLSSPKAIDGDGSINLVEAAAKAGVQQFIMVTSLGTGKVGFPAALLNLFGGILAQKRRAEVVLEDSGIPYLIVRPGGLERPTDAYKLTNNVRLETRDRLFGGQVSRLQVAELIATAVANPELAENKTLEVVAEPTAPLLSYEALLEAAPVEVDQEERLEQLAERAAAQEIIDAAKKDVERAQANAGEAQLVLKSLTEAAKEAKAALAKTRSELAPSLKEADAAEAQLAKLRSAAVQSQRREAATKAILAASQAAARELRVLTKEERTAIERPLLFPEEVAAEEAARKAAEEQARQIAEAKAQKEAEARARAEAAEEAKREAEEEKARAAQEAKAQKEAQARAQKEAVEREKREAEQAKAKKEAEIKAQKEAAEKSKQDEASRAEAEAKAKKDAEAKAKADAAASAKAQEDTKAKKEAEAKSAEEAKGKREAQAKAAAELEARVAKAAADEQAAKEAEAKAKKAAEAKAKKEAEEKAAQEAAEAKAKKEAEEKAIKAKKEADEKAAQAKKEADEKAAKQAEEKKLDPVPSQAERIVKSAAVPPNVAEARAWIAKWRSGGAAAAAPAGGSSFDLGSIFSGFKLPWGGGGGGGAAAAPVNVAKAATNGVAKVVAAAVPENVAEAREWIRTWRAKNLNASLSKTTVKP